MLCGLARFGARREARLSLLLISHPGSIFSNPTGGLAILPSRHQWPAARKRLWECQMFCKPTLLSVALAVFVRLPLGFVIPFLVLTFVWTFGLYKRLTAGWDFRSADLFKNIPFLRNLDDVLYAIMMVVIFIAGLLLIYNVSVFINLAVIYIRRRLARLLHLSALALEQQQKGTGISKLQSIANLQADNRSEMTSSPAPQSGAGQAALATKFRRKLRRSGDRSEQAINRTSHRGSR
jgi:hypothetical protein